MNLTKNILGRALIIAPLTGCVVFLALIVYPLQNSTKSSPESLPASSTPAPPKPKKPAQIEMDYGLPLRLKIPSINVDATISPLGLTPEGDMESPSEPQAVGWYKFGPHPGDKGSAVIAGHYGPRRNGGGSVFDDLQKLNKGDKLYVEDEERATAIFVVRETRRYDPEANALDVFASNDDRPHLNLITCEGVWNENLKTYSSRLVVFADRE